MSALSYSSILYPSSLPVDLYPALFPIRVFLRFALKIGLTFKP